MRPKIVFSFGLILILSLTGFAIAKARSSTNDTNPIWSPDGKKIVFLRGYPDEQVTHLFVINADGSHPVDLTPAAHNSDQNDPSWSPDGKRILYRSGWSYHLMNTDGTQDTVLIAGDDSSHNGFATWSPDGKQIAYVSTQNDHSNIYVISVDGKNKYRLVNDIPDTTEPAWSPDGKTIVFLRRLSTDPTKPSGQIETIPSDGSAPPQIFAEQSLAGTMQSADFPTWSPDGKYLAFTAIINADRSQLEVVAYPSGAVQTIISADKIPGIDSIQSTLPRWSPDSKMILMEVVEDLPGMPAHLESVSILSGKLKALTPGVEGGIEDSSWSPDGKYISFALNPGPGIQYKIARINADGTKQVILGGQ